MLDYEYEIGRLRVNVDRGRDDISISGGLDIFKPGTVFQWPPTGGPRRIGWGFAVWVQLMTCSVMVELKAREWDA